MKGIIYTRVSSDEQVKGTSLDDQETKCRRYCAENNIEVIKVFREEGASAKSAERKEFLTAIEFCRKNKETIDAFVVLRVDRFARNIEDHFKVRKILADYKVSLHSVMEPIGDNPIEKFMETLLAASAEFDNSIRAQRCSAGMIAKLNQGIWPWKPPVGYTCAHNKKQGQKKLTPDEPDEIVFPIIQNALKRYATGSYTQAEILQTLKAQNLAAKSGLIINLQFVHLLLTKYLKFYAGILTNKITGDGMEFEGKHTPMITREEYQRIVLLKSGKKLTSKYLKHNPDFPLRRFVKCGECNKPLTGSTSSGNGGKYHYYHCYSIGCSLKGKLIAKNELETIFLKCLQEICPQESFLAIFNETVLAHWKDQGHEFEANVQRHEKKIEELNAKKKKVSDMRENGEYTSEEFKARKEEIENEITTEKISLSESRIDQFDIEAALVYATNFIRDLPRLWFDSVPSSRSRFQKLVFPEAITYDRGIGFRTAKLGCIFELNKQFLAQNSNDVDRTGFEPATSSLQMRRSTN